MSEHDFIARFFNWVAANPMPVYLVAGLISMFLLGLAAYYLIDKMGTPDKFEKIKLSTVIGDELDRVLGMFGAPNGSTFRYNKREIGTVHRDMLFTEPGELEDEIGLGESDLDNWAPEEPSDLSDDDLDQLRDQLEKHTELEEEQIDRIVDNDMIPHRLLEVRPGSILTAPIAAFTDDLLSMGLFGTKWLLPEHLLQDNPGDNSITLSRNVQVRPFAGVWAPLTYETFGILHNVSHRKLYAQALEDQVNYGRRVNYFSDMFSMRAALKQLDLEDDRQEKIDELAGDARRP